MRHLVISRFNAGNPDPDFFDYRLELFRGICLPSLLAQSVNPDLVQFYFICDPATSGSRLNELRRKIKALPIACLTFGTVENRVSISTGERVITTRIDNDDAIAPFFLAGIEAALGSDDSGYACYQRGAYWDLNRKRWRHVQSSMPNQFLSRISIGDHRGSFKSVYEVKHGDARPCRFIESDGPAWVWTLHSQQPDRQMSNKTGHGITPYLNASDDEWEPEEELFEHIPAVREIRS